MINQINWFNFRFCGQILHYSLAPAATSSFGFGSPSVPLPTSAAPAASAPSIAPAPAFGSGTSFPSFGNYSDIQWKSK